jgi:serine/threonine protein kinase
METRPSSHPPADVLLALGAGKLDDATADAIFFHVEVCPDCLKTAGRLAGDSFLDKLRAARGYSGTPAPSKVLSSFPAAGYTAPIPTTSERPAMTILPELRDHPQYEVLRELGRGGMGVVYLAKNKLMDRLEVLKVVNKTLLGEAGAAERFLREIRAAAQLNHPNIVTAYSALQVGDVLLFSMEFIEGRDLAQVVKARGPLPAAHAGSYVLQAARGLQHAFEKGMVHRDIKPQNLILHGKTNIVKILDFGLAKATHTTGIPGEGLTGLNMMMGTPDYMAPEQARDAANVDIRADIYSLGCTLYCLLAGRAPFVGGSLATKLAAHQLSEPEPVESLRSDLPPGLAEIVRKMMAKDPDQRYQKPEEVVQALTICFKGKGKQPTAKASPENIKAAKPVAAPKLGAKGEGKSIYTKKTIAPIAAPRQTMSERPSPVVRRKNEEKTWQRRKWLTAAGGAAIPILLGLIGLWAAGLFKAKPAASVLVPGAIVKQSTKIPAYEHGGGKWTIQGDELVQDSTELDPVMLLFGDASWKDYEVTVDAKLIAGKELCFVGFRIAELGNGYYFGPWAGRSELHLHTLADGTNTEIAPAVPCTLDDQWHTMRVRVRGDEIQCFMDDGLIFKRQDNRHQAGYVGLATPKTATRFRNLKVTAADGRILVGGVGDLEILGEHAETPVNDPFKVGTIWRGTGYLNERGRNLPPSAVKIVILKREGTAFEGEYSADVNEGRLKIVGNMDPEGNISWRATEILQGSWVDTILDPLWTGTIVGRQMRVSTGFPGLTLEVRAVRED